MVRAEGRRKLILSDAALALVKVIFLTITVVICVYPFWNIFVISINDATDAIRGGLYLWPRKLSFESYANILNREAFRSSVGVTVWRTVIGTLTGVLCTTALAYVLSRKHLMWRRGWNLLFIFTMYFSGGMVPYYMVLKNLNLLNTFSVYIVPSIISVYNMILVRNYMEGIPGSLFEAAEIDGANDLVIFFRVAIPLAKPTIMTIVLFTAIRHWNSWFDCYLYTDAASLKVVQAILVEILNQYQTSATAETNRGLAAAVTPDSIRMAAMMVATIPIILVYPFVQRYFVKGIMLGAVKS